MHHRNNRSLIELPLEDIKKAIGFAPEGLSEAAAAQRRAQYGLNEVKEEKPLSPLLRLWKSLQNPLVILLTVLGLISLLTGDLRSTIVIFSMVVLGVAIRYTQEMRADKAAEKLKALVSTHATVCRNGEDKEVPLKMLVPGDIVKLGAGDMIPADVRLLTSKDLFLNQAVLTGESLPVEKVADPVPGQEEPLYNSNNCFLGTNVESGTATALVVHTGEKTDFGALAAHISRQQVVTGFDKGINSFTWLMIRFMLVMVPAVFLINGLSRHNWLEAFLFALSVAVGLTPEMLPMIVTVNLSKGAIAMSRKKVIVKKLSAIQNFGAMDVLCTDKTGTLTEGRIVLEQYLNPEGTPDQKVLDFGYLNSYYHTGLKNLMDEAILHHEEVGAALHIREEFSKIDEIPFDFVRKRMSVVLENKAGLNILICKGAVEGIMERCTQVEINGQTTPLSQEQQERYYRQVEVMNAQGFRVVALAYKWMPGAPDAPVYSVTDESELVLLGYLSFLDPPKDTASAALHGLSALKVDVRILTGDNESITAYICRKVGVNVDRILLGPEIEHMTDEELVAEVVHHHVFAKLAPVHKLRIIKAIQQNGHVTGFMGDGINDAPALKAADVGISVNTAVDIAKEASDIILLENNLMILEQGVAEGRRVFGNIIKYIRMAASSNFGNMFSVVGASAFLPFLPMLPIQVLINNLLYDFSQTAIPTDNVDAEWLVKPRRWTISELQRFILVIGPISSVFDYITFWLLITYFGGWNNPALFHTGWFIESLFTQTLIIHVIRTNKIPFIESRASWELILTSICIVIAGAWLTVSPLAATFGFTVLPAAYWVCLFFILIAYVALTQIVKNWFNRRFVKSES
ncbi:magnesium-translocating P-type ATPase [Chitinophaga sp. HK235]|uniref:magnesium-translocating P-type ATPase n=1 Tax=Chitinophaga sp. HK235 TaxID=2952571 RepID=UPI001BA7DB84|nr:magnesium-translocating P-type ATPase [Chitinophaga sp. HK235]